MDRIGSPPEFELLGEVTFERILMAADRLAGVAHRTPVMTCRAIDEAVGARVSLKCESFQRCGAFKFRGAYNALAAAIGAGQVVRHGQRGGAGAADGVLAFSSGNHAQAVALSARLLGLRAVIVMPDDAPSVKRAATEAYLTGTAGRVVAYDPARTKREALAAEVAEREGLLVIPPYDHPDVIAGQGTAGLELLTERAGLRELYVPCGGGGLLSGCATAARGLGRGVRVIGVEPAGADDAARSFREGVLRACERPETIADGARTPFLGRFTFAALMDRVDEMVTVSDEEIVGAMRLLWERAKLVVEPTGALGLAGLLKRRGQPWAGPGGGGESPRTGEECGVILSGGNVDIAGMAAVMSRGK